MSRGLSLRGLGLRHGTRAILAGVSLEVGPGESLCLVGASGSGKSLIAAAIAGLLPAGMAAAGEVRIDGAIRAATDQAGLRALWHRQICLLPQEPGAALAPLTRALDQVRLGPHRLPAPAAYGKLLRVGLDRAAARRLPAELSGGMAQRLLSVLVARSEAGVLVVDEPTTGLDPARRAEVVAMLAALRAAGRTLLVITHDLDVVRTLDGGLAVLEAGTVAEAGSAGAALAEPRSRFLRACLAADAGGRPTAREGARGSAVVGADGLVVGRRGKSLAGPLALDLRQGRITAVLGPSGAGKTTLGDTVLGLERPCAGTVSWLGRQLDPATRVRLRAQFQKLHQDPTAVFPAARTFGEILGDLGRLHGSRERSEWEGWMERLGISPDLLGRRPEEVSGGEAQRLALVRLLAVRPLFLVADEPCSRLDPPTRAETLRLLRRLTDETGLSVLWITHDAVAAAAMADTCLALTAPGAKPARLFPMCVSRGQSA